ncbi:MAG: hypothetical protein AB1918_00005 [Pseudomonadota bacterium]
MIEAVTYSPAIEKARKGSYILGIILFLVLGFIASRQMESALAGIFFGGVGAAGYVFLQGRKLDKLPSFTFTPEALVLDWPGGRQSIRWDEVASMERKGSGNSWTFRTKAGGKIPVRVLGFEPDDLQAITNRLEAHRGALG